MKVLVAQTCLTLCDPMDCSPPGSVHGIFQARILEWVSISSSMRSSPPRDQIQVSHNPAGRFYTVWATREAPKGTLPSPLDSLHHYESNLFFINIGICYPYILVHSINIYWASVICNGLGYTMKADSLEKTLMLGKIEGKRRGSRGWDC